MPRGAHLRLPLALAAGLLLLAGCGTPSAQPTHPTGADRAACRQLLHDLPRSLTGHDRVEVTGSRYAVAWGDPAIVLRCGVGRPKGFDQFSQCQSYDGIDWYVPDSASTDQSSDVVATTVGRSPAVEVTVPAQYRPPVDELVDVGAVVRRTTRVTHPCT